MVTILIVCSHSPIPRQIRMACIESCGCVQTAQRQTSTQILTAFCVNLLVSIYLGLGVGQSKRAIK